jgi:hypothetical protein
LEHFTHRADYIGQQASPVTGWRFGNYLVSVTNVHAAVERLDFNSGVAITDRKA